MSEMPPGLHWRTELVEELLKEKQGVKSQFARRRLMNIVRGYVPAVFEYHLDEPSLDKIKWFPSYRGNHIMNKASYKWVKEEIEKIGREFSDLPKLDCKIEKRHEIMIEVTKRYGWSTGKDARVGYTDYKNIDWSFDGIKNRVALEVELSSRPAIFKQCFKFLVGQGLEKIDLGVIMVHRHKIGSGPNFDSVHHDITSVLDALPTLAVVVSGF